MICDTAQLTAELAAVWEEMFDGVATILKAAESIDALAAKSHPGVGQEVSQAVARIFEACAFQDIAGQRIAKVASSLARFEVYQPEPDLAFIDIPDDELLDAPELPGFSVRPDALDELLAFLPKTSKPRSAAENDQAGLKNGPGLPGHVLSQDAIDDLFNLVAE